MCLILFAVTPSPQCHLVVAANRDEQHGRATARAEFWQEAPEVLAGRDLVAGGTWLGLTRSGRFAAVTNFAEPPPEPLPPLSRGELTANFLKSDSDCVSYLQQVEQKQQQYRGFNLIVSDGEQVYYFSNRAQGIRKLDPGYYGLSNQLLDCDWAKVIHGREEIANIVNQAGDNDTEMAQQLFQLLAERDQTAKIVDPHRDKFILGDQYGTGVSTVVIQRTQQANFFVKGFANDGSEIYSEDFTF